MLGREETSKLGGSIICATAYGDHSDTVVYPRKSQMVTLPSLKWE